MFSDPQDLVAAGRDFLERTGNNVAYAHFMEVDTLAFQSASRRHGSRRRRFGPLDPRVLREAMPVYTEDDRVEDIPEVSPFTPEEMANIRAILGDRMVTSVAPAPAPMPGPAPAAASASNVVSWRPHVWHSEPADGTNVVAQDDEFIEWSDNEDA
ncbi:uncharacterized protein UV8b_05732 [Ustilaginoidea virens]|uniref:Uncharacterized protein n=1 Tax=Ustilaginoidea virens TaxID=1159556 RepID=A0A8E5HTY5_USTVR|nr:uncharacterized protein UV8b_05732 [Ustilaginoidea virens]QUC21489.1 hypothetical protein UV8b_05732 [Ustilaginoidea virens]